MGPRGNGMLRVLAIYISDFVSLAKRKEKNRLGLEAGRISGIGGHCFIVKGLG